MRREEKLALGLVLLCVSQGVLAHGDVSCTAPKTEWRPRVELQRKLKSEGWTIRNIKILNGCYEVYGFDANDAKVEAFFNPKTFDRVG